jgi:hypothetical protein
MPRTTPELVGQIVTVRAGDDLTAAILTANVLVTKVCGASDYEADQFELIERWLAAHFYVIWRPRSYRERAGPVAQEFEPIKVDLGLDVTKYGQTAMRLDTDGSLAALNNRQKKLLSGAGATTVQTVWVGTEREGY